MSIQNFPRIPKIILKKPAEQGKDTKNEKVSFFRANVSDPITRLAKPLCSGGDNTPSGAERGYQMSDIEQYFDFTNQVNHNLKLDSTLQGREARSLGTFSSLASLSLVFHSTRDPTPDHVSPASDRSDGC